MTQAQFQLIGEGVLFPEGPVSLGDGSVIVVDMLAGLVVRLMQGRSSEVIASVGGGPNGAALGPDGKLYVVNNGGFAWTRSADGKLVITGEPAPGYAGGWIDRVDLVNGRIERLYDRVGEHHLASPNDIVFDRQGGFWFTDTGKTIGRSRSISGVYYAAPNAAELREVIYGGTSFNGIGLAADERTLYVADSREATLWAYTLSRPGTLDKSYPPRVVTRIARHVYLDSLALLENGDVCVGTVFEGGITTISPSGKTTFLPLPDRYVTNICFGGSDRRDAYITLSESGRVVRVRWPEPGLQLNFSS